MRAHNDLASASVRRQPEASDQAALASEVMGHLADPTRMQLLRLLATGELDVSSLVTQVKASRSSVSQHLGRLRLAGLVVARREGRRMLYRVSSDHLHALVEEAYQFAGHLMHDLPHHNDRQRGG